MVLLVLVGLAGGGAGAVMLLRDRPSAPVAGPGPRVERVDARASLPDAARIRPDAAWVVDRGPDVNVAPKVVRLPRPGPGGHAVAPQPLPSDVAQELEAARQLLQQDQLAKARRSAERLLLHRDLPQSQRWRVHALLAQIYCAARQLGGAKDNLRKVPPRARGAVKTFCRRYLDIVP